jgi:hypothetical protein
MNTTRYALLLTALGLAARPACALGNQLDGWIYAAVVVAGLLAVGGVILVIRFLQALFSPRLEPTGKFGQVTIPSGKEAVFFIALALALLLSFYTGW